LLVQHRFPLQLRKLDPETSISTPVPTRLFQSRFGLFTSPESLFTCPESLFTSSRNLYSHRPGIAIHMPRNTQATPEKHERYLFNIAIAIADHEKMLATAESMRESYEEAVAENAKEQQRVRELRSNNAAPDKRSSRSDKGKGWTRKKPAKKQGAGRIKY
jgi:hypothetical protein